MIQGHPQIDRVLPFDALTALTLQHERFDTVISLDKEPQPCALAMSLEAGQKLGVGLSPHGTPVPLNREARHYFALGLSDEMKFRENTSTYPRLIHEALGLGYSGQRYELPRNDDARRRVRERLGAAGVDFARPLLGINVGAGRVFANKMWPAARTTQLIAGLRKSHPEAQVLLLGGPDERPAIDALLAATAGRRKPARVFDAGTDHDEPSFVALVDACDALFSGDTMAMHVAIALGKPAVVFFGPTCEQEIDLFGRGEKLVARPACAPCYKRRCDKNDACIDAVSVDDALAAIGRTLDRLADRTLSLPVLPASPLAA
jgi:heptosyltransferase-2